MSSKPGHGPRLVKSTRTAPPSAKRAYASVKLTMPKWYIEALAAEAERLRWSRGQFLEFLVLRARGELSVERNPSWPKLKEPKDPGPNESYLWNCPRQVMDDLDKIKNPGVGYSMWLYFAFREWLGHPVAMTIAPR
jgi:hypothetical protein